MKNRKTALYQYLDEIKYAKLDCRGKALLYFYAVSYNWTKNKPSWYSQRSISALTGMAASTYHEYQKYLIKLGWIQVKKRGRNAQNLIWVAKGKDDPNYELHSWAKWHPFNVAQEPNYVEEMKDFDPLSEDGDGTEFEDSDELDEIEDVLVEANPNDLGVFSGTNHLWDMFENSTR